MEMLTKRPWFTWIAVVLLLSSVATLAGEVALRAAVAAERAKPRAMQFDRAAFLAKPTVLGAWLSPDGRYVAYLHDDGSNRSVGLLGTVGGDSRRLLSHRAANSLAWSRDSRWLLVDTPSQLLALAVAGQTGSGSIAKLSERREFLAADPVMPAAAIVLERPRRATGESMHWRLYRVDIRGNETLLYEDTQQIVDFAFDPRGQPVFVIRIERDKYVIYRVTDGRLHEALRCVNLERCSLLSVDARGDLILATDVGSDLYRLARLDVTGRLQTLHVDPLRESDLDTVVLDPVSREPLIVGYCSTVAAQYALASSLTHHVSAIERQYPLRDLNIDVSAGSAARWLIRETVSTLQGERLHLYDPKTGGFRTILEDMQHQLRGRTVRGLPESALARKVSLSYRATDGMPIHGFLSLPPGVDAARAPLVVVVHGGPFSATGLEFSAVSQLLANRGYVVFEPNFRGSTGHGRRYLFAGDGDFGNGRVQQDIVDGVRYLLAQGIGDAEKVGLVGSSFGGYAALQGITFEPGLFKVGIAAAPPVDFGWMTRWQARREHPAARGIPIGVALKALALDPADAKVAARLRAESPSANAHRLARPLLLVAGGHDERVPIRSVTHYAAQLRNLGKEFSLFLDSRAGHTFEDPHAREAYLYLMEAMLHRHLGGMVPQVPSEALGEYLRRHLLITGSENVFPSSGCRRRERLAERSSPVGRPRQVRLAMGNLRCSSGAPQ